MKKLLLLSVIVLFSLYAVNVFAEPVPVRVFNSDYSISGRIFSDRGQFPEDSYNESGSIPLSNSVRSPAWVGFGDSAIASSGAGFFYVNAAFSVGQARADATAVAEWLFQPLAPMDHLTIYKVIDPQVASGQAGLLDLTDGTEIWSEIWEDWDVFGNENLITYAFQTDHVYRLNFSVLIGGPSSFGAHSSIYTNDMIAVVPEPATMLLLGFGLVGLAGIRRKLSN